MAYLVPEDSLAVKARSPASRPPVAARNHPVQTNTCKAQPSGTAASILPQSAEQVYSIHAGVMLGSRHAVVPGCLQDPRCATCNVFRVGVPASFHEPLLSSC